MNQGFTLPSFLLNQSVDEIHANMMSHLPDDIDKGENGFPWDFTRPTAIEKSRMVQYVLSRAIQNLVPAYADDEQILEYHAQCRGITRGDAVHAKAAITIKGAKGTVVPAGFKFSTAATLEDAGIVFGTDAEAVIPENGEVSVSVTAETPGACGNVAAGTIIMVVKPLSGIQSVTNPEAANGGSEEEEMEHLRNRILEYDQNQGNSFVGSVSDYKRWAEETVEDENSSEVKYIVGNAKVLPSEDGSGKVSIIVTDRDGNPADSTICQKVTQHIMGPDNDPSKRLAPVNAVIEVIQPAVIPVSVAAAVKIDSDYTLEAVKSAFADKLTAYIKSQEAQQEVVYAKIGSLLIETGGVMDYLSLKVNGGEQNLIIEDNSMPVMGEVTLSEGSV